MTTKPALPARMFDPFPRIPVDTSDGSPFSQLLRVGLPAADEWTFGPDGPYDSPGQTGAQVSRAQVTEVLLHLLELGFIDIDTERMNAASGWPLCRETGNGETP